MSTTSGAKKGGEEANAITQPHGVLGQRFELRARLGEGGMGIVYRAWDRTLGKDVGLKRMQEIGATQALRLKAEFRARSALQHKNLVQLYELFMDGDDCFFTMEIVEGTDLESWVRYGEAHNATVQEPPRSGSATRHATTIDEKALGSGVSRRAEDDDDEDDEDHHFPDDPSATARVNTPGVARPPSRTRKRQKPRLDASGVARLREALTDLCIGLSVLHDATIIHRDVKPANVRVDHNGRVVLLDFGLAARPTAQTMQDPDFASAGTPRYMAPEQVRGEGTTAATDLYAIGGILYELLSGRSAFGGSALSNQLAKASGARPPPIPIGESPDEDLARLAIELLDPDPAARPDSRATLERLAPPIETSEASGDGGVVSTREIRVAAPTFGLPTPGGFFGRREEAAKLEAALHRVTSERRPIAVIVGGPSGIGKSTLIRSFLTNLKTSDKRAIVLAARCHPQESVPFKALDAAMDGLAEHASKIPDLGPFAPAAGEALVRLFPVLRSIPVLTPFRASSSSRAEDAHEGDDSDMRVRGFDALRDLFWRVASRGRLVLWIDDVQWDDADSLVLIEALLRQRGGRAPPVLVLISMRSESRDSAIVGRMLDDRRSSLLPVDRITLGPLESADSAKLAAVFLGEGDARIDRVVQQAEGNPFLACELARYVATRAPTTQQLDVDVDVDVQALVAERLRDLAPPERALLDVASLAVRPLSTASAIEAAHLTAEANTSVLALRDAFLIRHGVSLHPALPGETIAPYHDKIAEATQQLLSTDERRSIHRSLAETIERHDPDDHDVLCVHWEGAGNIQRAARSAYLAAEHAATTLAFDRAAVLYEKAIAFEYSGVDLARLFERAATAHANHGRAPEAAKRYLDASRALGDDVIRNARVRTLKRLAAEQYVKSGYVKLGWQVMRSVLDAAGIPQPSSPGRATVSALRRRLRFLARRIDVDGIGNRQIPEAEKPRLEILWTASTSMSMIDVTLSDAFRTQHLERILDVGDASSVARALAYEVALEAHVGGPLFDWHASRLLDHARRLVERTGDPYDQAWFKLGIANQAFCAGRFRDAAIACRESETILRTKCSGVAWEITTVTTFLLTSLAMLGELSNLRETTERFTGDAEDRGDLFAIAEGYTGECIFAWWALGRAGDAQSRGRAAVANQGRGDAERWPEKTHRRGQLTELMSNVHLHLGLNGESNDPWPAWQMMQTDWPGLKSSMITSLQFYRSWLRHGRARLGLACMDSPKKDWTREKLKADVCKMHAVLAQEKKPFGAPWADLIEGALAHRDDDRMRTTFALERAMMGFDRADMALYREAARWRLAELTKSSARRDEAESWMKSQGVSEPEVLVRVLAPGY